MSMAFTDNEFSLQPSVSRKQKTFLELVLILGNGKYKHIYNDGEMFLIHFCGNIFFGIFSVIDRKSVTDAGLIDSFLTNPLLSKSNFCIRA